MDAKEKARDLVNTFYALISIKEEKTAKHCALTAVDEIVKILGGEIISNHPTGIYWQKVKQEIIKF